MFMPGKLIVSPASGGTSIEISFIIVSWNAKGHLLKCLDSLTRTEKGYTGEIIVVDNASTDGSPQAVRERFPGVVLVENAENLGFARANNAGLQMARGRYLCLINSDVELLEGCVATLLREMEREPKLGMIGPLLLEADGRTQISCWGFPSLWNMFCCALALDGLFPSTALFNGYQMRHFKKDEARNVDILGGAFWLTLREAVQEVGPLDEGFFMYGEDMDWCKRFWEKGWPIRFCPKARAIHYGGASSANAPIRFYIEMLRANLQYWRKHHSGAAWLAIYFVYGLHHLVRIGGHFGASLVRAKKRAEHRFKTQRSLACLAWLLRTPFSTRAGAPNALQHSG
jgi:GT2 family glycosyltransferase